MSFYTLEQLPEAIRTLACLTRENRNDGEDGAINERIARGMEEVLIMLEGHGPETAWVIGDASSRSRGRDPRSQGIYQAVNLVRAAANHS